MPLHKVTVNTASTIFVIEAFIPILLILFYLTSIDVIWLFKIVPISYTLLVFFYHLYNPIKTTFVSVVFLVFGVLAAVVAALKGLGLVPLEGNFGFKYFATHIYSVLIPILAISCGKGLARFDYNYLYKCFSSAARIALIVTIIIVGIYFFFYSTGYIQYWGLSTLAYYYIAFTLVERRQLLSIIAVIVIFLSGKRAVIVNSIAVFLVNYWFVFFSHKVDVTKLLITGVVVVVILTSSIHLGMFKRFDYLINVDFDNSSSILAAFSGRFEEVIAVFEYFESCRLCLITGAGVGSSYYLMYAHDGYETYKNYAHFSPVAFLFRFGIIFVIIIYGNLLYLIIKARRMFSNPFYLCLVGSVVGSAFGANLLIDVLPWLFYGVIHEQYKGKIIIQKTSV